MSAEGLQAGPRLATDRGVCYAWRQLAQRAGAADVHLAGTGFESLGVSAHYAAPDNLAGGSPSITVTPTGDAAWWNLLQRPSMTLDWLPAHAVVPPGLHLPFSGPIPVLFWGEGCEDGSKPFAERREDGAVVFNADIIAATLFMLSRWEETVVPARDRHDRFPATASVAYRQGFLDRPVVDEYALILRAWLQTLCPQWAPRPNHFAVKLSHDVDLVRDYRSLQQAVRRMGGDLLRRKSPRQAWQTALGMAMQIVDPRRAARFAGIETLARLSNERALDSAFYFMAAAPSPLDSDYHLSSDMIRACIWALQEQGFEIGYHASYHTLDNPGQLAEEKACLDAVLGETHYGGRQHTLRFHAPATWRHWQEVGLSYDSTMAYADHEGFRCGTCHPFRPFDVEQDRELRICERPLIAMDVTLRQYRGLTPRQAVATILSLARRCRQVEGTFTLLWHNSSLSGEWRLWLEAYHQVLQVLSHEVGAT